jgi:RimJ/RimL family protein N-acetyltransferase
VSPSFDDVDWPVRTERLTLRPATPADAEVTWPYHSDPATAEWLVRLPANLDAHAERYASPEVLDSTIMVEHAGEVIGDLHLGIKDGWAQQDVTDAAIATEADLGWVLAPEHRGHGYGREAVAALLAICFDDLGLRRVTAGCFAVNEPSWRLMESLGMRREAHTVRDGLHRDHGWMDGFEYALLADEWASSAS